jgi:hypothetical protein
MSFEGFTYSPAPLTTEEEIVMKNTIQFLLKNPKSSSDLSILTEFQNNPISEELFTELGISKSRKIKRYKKIPNNCGDSQQKEALNFEKNKKKIFQIFSKLFPIESIGHLDKGL